jgi:hypothetical protein
MDDARERLRRLGLAAPPSPSPAAYRVFAEQAAERMRDFGMPANSKWAFVFTPDPIDRSRPETAVALVTADPAERTVFRVDTTPYKGIAGRTLQLFGRLVDPESTLDGPHWKLLPDDASPQIAVEVWEMRTFKHGAPCLAERTWLPGVGEHATIHFLSDDWTDADVNAAARAARWLRDFKANIGRGRHKHYTEANEPQFFEALKLAAHGAVRAGEDLTPTSLSRYGIGDRRTISDALDLYGYDLEKVQAEAVRCTGGGANICTFHVRRRSEFKKKRV